VKTFKDIVLIVLYRQFVHCQELEVIDLARQNSVQILFLSLLITHWMRSQDRTFMGTLKAHYIVEV